MTETHTRNGCARNGGTTLAKATPQRWQEERGGSDGGAWW